MQIRTLQYLRAVAASAVVLCHIHLWEAKALGQYAVTPEWLSIGNAGVDLFFVISGFIMVFIQPQHIHSLRSYWRFLSHRFTRIYPPYWIVTAALIPIWIARPGLFNNFYDNKVDLVRSLLLWPQDYTPLLGVAWTLIHEVYFYLVVSLALIFRKPGRWIFGSIWFVLVGFTVIRVGDAPVYAHRLWQLVFSPFSLTFLLGYFIGLAYVQIRRMSPVVLGLVAGLGVAGLLAGLWSAPPVMVYPNNNDLVRFAVYGVPCACLVFAAVGLDASLRRNLTTLTLLGDASYAIYLIHLPVVSGFYAIVKVLHPQNVLAIISLAATCLLICLSAAVVFHTAVERKIIRFFRTMIEKRLPSGTP